MRIWPLHTALLLPIAAHTHLVGLVWFCVSVASLFISFVILLGRYFFVVVVAFLLFSFFLSFHIHIARMPLNIAASCVSNKNIHKNCIALLATRRLCIYCYLACMCCLLALFRLHFLLSFVRSFGRSLSVSMFLLRFLFQYGIWAVTVHPTNEHIIIAALFLLCCRSHIHTYTRSHTIIIQLLWRARAFKLFFCFLPFSTIKLLPRLLLCPVRFHLFSLFIFHTIYFHFFLRPHHNWFAAAAIISPHNTEMIK